jgi:hypothetical protein
MVKIRSIWDRCYDFLNFFAEKFSEKIGVFCTNYCKNCAHNIGFWDKRHFFRRILGKIAENCDHNIDPGHPSWQLWIIDTGKEMSQKLNKVGILKVTNAFSLTFTYLAEWPF